MLIASIGRSWARAALICLSLAGTVGNVNADDVSVASAAFTVGRAGDWWEARRVAASASDPLVPALIVWMDATRQPQGGGSFNEVTGVLIDHPDWPQQRTLRQRAEQALDDNLSDAAVLSWFERNEPVSLNGARRYAYALIARGDNARAASVARTAWVNADAASIDEEDTFVITFHDLLSNDEHVRRLDRLIWAGRTAAAQRLLARIDDSRRTVAEARIALRQGSAGATDLLALVPAEHAADPGLVYEQARWYRRQGNGAMARQVLAAYPVDAARPEPFWQERGQLSRSALAEASAEEAYRTASAHGFTDGSEFIDSEWLAGWIALRFLQQPEQASRHFLAMFDAATHPVSRARGAYWLARTASAQGDMEATSLWHRAAAQHAIAFYGQLSAAEIRPGEPLRLPPDPIVTADEATRFHNHDLVRAIRLLAAIGESDAVRWFVLRLADAGLSAGWKDLTASLAHEIDRPDLAVAVARRSVREGMPLVRNGYPIVAVAEAGIDPALPVELPLIFGVIRQESGFDSRAISSAGARGLMQLMPDTARSVAGSLGMTYSAASLTTSPQYNIDLGRAYLSKMLRRFDGSYLLALAAYNAGPGRVSQWLNSNGDPRRSSEAAVDWIELIPFNETRNYVQRCLENLQVYRARTGGLQLAQSLGNNLLR